MGRADFQPCEGCRHARCGKVTSFRGTIFHDVLTKMEIVEILAKERRVETLVANIAHSELTADLKDLSQMVYLILLEYDDNKILDLWNNNQINFFLARVIINQYRSSNSPFHAAFRRYQERSVQMGVGGDINEETIERIVKKLNAKSQ